MFSYFNETQKLAPFKEWLGWSDDEQKFLNAERLNEFYGWITEQPDDEGVKRRRIARAIDLREVAPLIGNDAAFGAFRQGKSAEDARRLMPSAPALFEQWKEAVAAANRAILEMPANVLESLSDDDRETLVELAEIIDRRLEQREAILAEARADAKTTG